MLSREDYRSLIEQAPIMIWRADLSMGCDYFNERWLEFTGRSIQEERGDGWTKGVHPEDLERCLEIYTSSFRERRVFEMEYRLKRHDGEWRWIFDRGAPSFDDAGAFCGYVGSCIDITARVAAERDLAARQQAELRELRELIPICAHCKKVRDDQGFWQRVETYVTGLTRKQFSHGICPECSTVHFPEV